MHDTWDNSTRRVLAGHPSVLPAPGLAMVVRDAAGAWPQQLGPWTMAIGVDSLALDRAGVWLYYAPVSNGVLYRVPAAALRDAALDDAALAARVEPFAPMPVSDGLSTDDAGNVYVTAFEQSAVARIDAADRALRLVVQDGRRLRWPDGLSFGPDGWLYLSNSALHLKFGGADMEAGAPYHIVRMRVPGSAAACGH